MGAIFDAIWRKREIVAILKMPTITMKSGPDWTSSSPSLANMQTRRQKHSKAHKHTKDEENISIFRLNHLMLIQTIVGNEIHTKYYTIHIQTHIFQIEWKLFYLYQSEPIDTDPHKPISHSLNAHYTIHNTHTHSLNNTYTLTHTLAIHP